MAKSKYLYKKDFVVKVILTKKQVNECLDKKKLQLEMAYPTNFSMEEFKNIQSYNGKMKYCQERLQRLSSGSARIVYKIDDEKVLKLAKNQKGLAQNQVEADFKDNSMRPDILAQTYDADENGYWVEMELATKIKPTDFKRTIDYPFEFIQFFCDKIEGEWDSKKGRMHSSVPGFEKWLELFYDEDYNNMPNWEWFNQLAEYIRNFQPPTGDLQRISSWGLVKRDGKEMPIIVDFGITDEVYNTHYSR